MSLELDLDFLRRVYKIMANDPNIHSQAASAWIKDAIQYYGAFQDDPTERHWMLRVQASIDCALKNIMAYSADLLREGRRNDADIVLRAFDTISMMSPKREDI